MMAITVVQLNHQKPLIAVDFTIKILLIIGVINERSAHVSNKIK